MGSLISRCRDHFIPPAGQSFNPGRCYNLETFSLETTVASVASSFVSDKMLAMLQSWTGEHRKAQTPTWICVLDPRSLCS